LPPARRQGMTFGFSFDTDIDEEIESRAKEDLLEGSK
jgi:hypothetical protein